MTSQTAEQKTVEESKRRGMTQRLFDDCNSHLFQAGQALERAVKDEHKNFDEEVKAARLWINTAVALHEAWKETKGG